MMRIMRNILLYVILYFISSITLVSHSAYLRRDYKKKLSGEIQYRNNNGILMVYLLFIYAYRTSEVPQPLSHQILVTL